MKKNRPYYKEVIRINKNESTYYSFGDEPEPIEFYYMLVCDNEQKCNTYSNECAPEEDYWIGINRKKSSGIVKIADKESEYLQNIVLLWCLPGGYMRAIILAGTEKKQDKMKLVEIGLIWPESEKNDRLVRQILSFGCKELFGTNLEIGRAAVNLLEVKEDNEEKEE